MNPADVAARDWHLYFNGTWMLHEKLGVVRVSVDGHQLYARKGGSIGKCVEPEELTSLWPMPRAINYADQGVYVGRRARREARRSATQNHYFIMWQEGHFCLDTKMMRQLCFPDEYPSLEWCRKALNTQEVNSVAWTPELILSSTTVPDRYGLVCKGFEAGIVEYNEDEGSFIPVVEDGEIVSQAMRRAMFKLDKGGYLCHSSDNL